MNVSAWCALLLSLQLATPPPAALGLASTAASANSNKFEGSTYATFATYPSLVHPPEKLNNVALADVHAGVLERPEYVHLVMAAQGTRRRLVLHVLRGHWSIRWLVALHPHNNTERTKGYLSQEGRARKDCVSRATHKQIKWRSSGSSWGAIRRGTLKEAAKCPQCVPEPCFRLFSRGSRKGSF